MYDELKLYFEFTGMSGYTRTWFAGDHRWNYETRVAAQPVSFINVPVARNVDSAIVQVAQFRGEAVDSTDLAIFGFVPVGRMIRDVGLNRVELQTGAFIKDGNMRDVIRVVQSEQVEPGDSTQVESRSWRFTMAPTDMQHLLRVEARAPQLDRGARSAQPLDVRSFPRDSMIISDIIVAKRVAPRDSVVNSWRDFFIEPSSGRLAPGSPLGLLWEIYNLTPDSTGTASYRVELTIIVDELIREKMAARVVGGFMDAIGLSAEGDDQLSITYDAQTTVEPGGRHVEYLTLDFGQVPNAEYELRLTITDLRTGVSATAVQMFAVDPTHLGN